MLMHYTVLAGHPSQKKMYYGLNQLYYWPFMATDCLETVRNCRHCASNRIWLRKHLHRFKLFPATTPLRSVAIDIPGPLPITSAGK